MNNYPRTTAPEMQAETERLLASLVGRCVTAATMEDDVVFISLDDGRTVAIQDWYCESSVYVYDTALMDEEEDEEDPAQSDG